MSVTVKISNPEMLRLVVTAELTISDWRSILSRTANLTYYAPLHDLLSTIRRGVEGIEKREVVTPEPTATGLADTSTEQATGTPPEGK